MRKIIYLFFLLLTAVIVFFTIYLSIIGLETSKFNKIIINEIKKKDPSIKLSLNKIKLKFDVKKIQIYLSTIEPQIIYQDIQVPIKEINLYTKLISILKSKNEINQAIISFENFAIKDIQQLAARIKPSNFKTYLLNNVNSGEIEKIFIDVKFGDNLNINEYKVNGSVKKVNIKISKDLQIKDVSLNFISDKNLTLINSLDAKYKKILITNGSLNLKRDKQIEINGKFNTQFSLNEEEIKKIFIKTNLKFLEKNKIKTKGSLLHNFSLKMDENFKLVDYEYKSNGKISEGEIIFKDSLKNNFLLKPIQMFSLTKTNLTVNLNKKKKIF